MHFRKYFSIFFASSSLLSFGIVENANADLRKQFQDKKACSFETAQYTNYVASNGATQRFCITPDGRVIGFVKDSKGKPMFGNWDVVVSEKLGKTDSYYDSTFYMEYNISQYVVEGNKLIKYYCTSKSDPYTCGSQLKEKIIAYKIGTEPNNTRKNQANSSSQNSTSTTGNTNSSSQDSTSTSGNTKPKNTDNLEKEIKGMFQNLFN
jgi:hypothetical protein